MATSGTVSTTTFTNRQILDHAFRRAGFVPEKVSGEALQIGLEILYLLTSALVNNGFPLWTRRYYLLGPNIGSPEVVCQQGDVDVIHSYWRTFNPYRGPAMASTGLGVPQLCGGQPNADMTIAGPNPAVLVNFTTPTEVDTVGVLLGGSVPVTTALNVNVSIDGINWTLFQTLPSATYQPGQWTYFDLDPFCVAQYIQVQYVSTGAWTVNQILFGLANGQDIEIGPLNIDDYYTLPNKQFSSERVVSAYTDRQVNGPVLKLWPTVNTVGFYLGAIAILSRRQIQDVGTMADSLEAPQRWNEAIIARLATRVIREIPAAMMGQDAGQASYFTLMAKQQNLADLDKMADAAEALAWAEERVKAPIRLLPNISGYSC